MFRSILVCFWSVPVHPSSQAGLLAGSERSGIGGLPHVAGVKCENVRYHVYMAQGILEHITGNGNPGSLSIHDTAWVHLGSSHATRITNGPIRKPLSFHAVGFGPDESYGLAGECFFYVYQQAADKLTTLLLFLHLA